MPLTVAGEQIARTDASEGNQAKLTCFAPEVLNLQCSKTHACGAIAIFVATSDSSAILTLKNVFLSGQATPAEAVNTLGRRMQPSKARGTLIEITYLQKVLASMHLGADSHACGVEVPFWGDALNENDFLVSATPSGRSLESLVVVRAPARSELAKRLDRQVPVDVSEMQDCWLPGEKAALVVMERGWAIGSYMAKIAVLRMQTRWRNQESGGGTPNREVAHFANASSLPADEDVDLTMPAEALLDRYVNRLPSR